MKSVIPVLLTLTQLVLTHAMFRDVTPANFAPPNIKFGGPAIADLDGNGFPDLILGYHGGAPVAVFFNFKGKFVKSPFKAGGDRHAYVPFRATPRDRGMYFTVSRGGSRGNKPKSPIMFCVNPRTQQIRNVTDESGITVRKGRGRSALYVDFSLNPKRSVPDVIYTNADPSKCPTCTGPRHHTFENVGKGKFELRNIPGLTDSEQNEVTAMDIDGDGIMEIIMFQPGIEIYKLIEPFKTRDITKNVLPDSVLRLRVQAIAELDFDNDGDFDLYLAIGRPGPRDRSKHKNGDDVLLENRDGVFVDVSERAGIPKGKFGYGVTTGDFNNDGHMDIYVVMYDEADILLKNNGDGTFTTVKNVIGRTPGSRGDMAQAVDFDRDGRIDIIVSEGERIDRTLPGTYRVFKNVLTGRSRRDSFVLVRVGSSPKGRAVSLHAVVTVTSGKKTWMRRVGSPGVAISSSYIELIHVGIGKAEFVNVSVKWANGEEKTVKNVAKGSRINVGTFGRSGLVRRGKSLV